MDSIVKLSETDSDLLISSLVPWYTGGSQIKLEA